MSSETTPVHDKNEGMSWRVSTSVFTVFGALIALIVWLFFYAGGFDVYQNLAIVAVIFLAFVAIIGGTWASWGMKHADWRD